MNPTCRGLRPWIGAALAAMTIGILSGASPANAGMLPIGTEVDSWSDMAFPTGVTGGYNAGALSFTVGATPSNDLELGGEFGPSNAGKHYGTGGTLGGPFGATLAVTGVTIAADGSVTNGGSVSIVLDGSAAGSLGTDYGIAIGASLLLGQVEEVLLDATGDNTLDVLFSISGGALQNNNPTLGINFAPGGLGLLRIAGVTLPSNFANSFSINGATINVLGIPEPGTIALVGSLVAGLAFAGPRRRRQG